MQGIKHVKAALRTPISSHCVIQTVLRATAVPALPLALCKLLVAAERDCQHMYNVIENNLILPARLSFVS